MHYWLDLWLEQQALHLHMALLCSLLTRFVLLLLLLCFGFTPPSAACVAFGCLAADEQNFSEMEVEGEPITGAMQIDLKGRTVEGMQHTRGVANV